MIVAASCVAVFGELSELSYKNALKLIYSNFISKRKLYINWVNNIQNKFVTMQSFLYSLDNYYLLWR